MKKLSKSATIGKIIGLIFALALLGAFGYAMYAMTNTLLF